MTITDEHTEKKINASILFVDDEKNILSALKRLFRPVIKNVFVAESGAEGLNLLEAESIDIIVSDMRMPEMDGAQFLEKAAEKWPDTIRILLTGYADIASTIDAINKGSIYRYISKPWEDNDLVLTIKHALKSKFLEQERLRLQKLTESQNEELKDLNANLEDKVKLRTDEVQQTMDQLELTYESLKENYDATIQVFSNILDLREGTNIVDNNSVSNLVIQIAMKLGMSEEEIQQIYYACLLRNIGRIGFSDEINKKSFNSLTNDEKEKVRQHPVIGQGVLMSLDYMQEAGKIIRNQYERYDGQGFPDALSGNEIPFGSKLIRLASDYYEYQAGLIYSKCLSDKEAQECIKRKQGMRYDPELVNALLEVVNTKDDKASTRKVVNEINVKSSELESGMKLSRDLALANGVVLLTKGHEIDEKIIRAIHKMENTMKEKMKIYVLHFNGEE